MTNTIHACFKKLLLPFAVITFFSCNNSGHVPFPQKEFGYTQPVAVPLQFTAARQLVLDTVKHGGIQPVVKKLDLSTLPAAAFDTGGFKPFSAPPAETAFDFNSLPATAFSPGKLPVASLHFKTYALNIPPAVKVSVPAMQKGNPIAIFDFGPRLGLPALFVTGVMKDRDGLMWICSKEGLFRYNGEYLQTILPASGGMSIAGIIEDNAGRIWFTDQRAIGMIDLPGGTVSYSTSNMTTPNNLCKMIKDRNGRIWICKTIAKQVVIVDPVAETFKSLDSLTGLSDSRGSNSVTEDSSGNIWLTTPTAGADIINWKEGRIRYLRMAGGLMTDSLRAITTDKTGRIWIAAVGGIAEAIDTHTGFMKHYTAAQGVKPAFTGDMSVDDKGLIWMGKSAGVNVLDPEHNRSRLIDDTKGLAANFVTACEMDDSRRMWVATIGGLNIIDQHAETVHPMGTTNIVSLMEDTIGNLWVATQKGIRLINTQKKLIYTIDKAHGLANDFVQSFVNFNQQMWVTSDGGWDVIDPIRKTLEHTGKREGLINDTVYVVYKDTHGNTWFTGPTNGIDLVDAANQNILHASVTGGLADNNILDVKEDKDGLIWMAGNAHGINIIDLKARTIKYLNNQPGLRDTCNRVMLKDSYGRLWLGSDKGIYVVDKEHGTLTPITTSNGLSNNVVTSLLEYKGSVIAGTNSKVDIITAPVPGSTGADNQWKISIVDKSDGLLREVPNAWATDAITRNGQYLWGDNGIAVLDEIKPVQDTATIYVTGINIMSKPARFANSISLPAHDTVWADDTFYVKGSGAMPAQMGGSKTLRWDSVSGPYNLPVNLQVPYNQNYIQLQFVQAHLSRQGNSLYTYILEGIDKSWSTPASNTTTENYLNLPPGSYTFKVSSKNYNNRWTEPATFSFTILPPWWQTWWAYVLFALIALAILRAYIAYRSRKLQRENKLLEEKIQLRTNQLQKSIEELKATQSQLVQSEKMASLGELTAGIAHEIQNPLNFINNFSDVNKELLAEMKEEIDNGNLSAVKSLANDVVLNEDKINHHGRRADAIVKSMLQHSRSNSHAVKEPANINKLADEYLRLAYHGLRAKDKSFNATLKTDYDERLSDTATGAPGIYIIPQDIGRVVLNLITNAFYAVTEKKKQGADKVSGDKYEPTVWVSTKKLADKVLISVRDNGNGIPQKILDKIFQPFFTTKPAGDGTGLGLSLAYDIVKAHGGELKVDTTEKEGSIFTIQLPVT